jgi:hypothetical protein
LYLNGDGVVVSKAMSSGGLACVEIERLMKVAPEISNEDKEVIVPNNDEEKCEEDNGVEITTEGIVETKENAEVSEPAVKFATEMVSGTGRSVRQGEWHVISVMVKPSAGKIPIGM